MRVSLEIPADSLPARIAAASNDDSTLSLAPSANCASASARASAIFVSGPGNLRCTTDSSTILAMKMVQVISEAKASPIITALTRISDDRNIDHGDSSCSPVDFSGLASAATAEFASVAAGTCADGMAATGACVVGGAGAGTAAGCDSTGTCCAAGAAPCCCAD